ncbi:E3 ubiquitin-protein ligase TRIM71-like [Ostrea edulis]|uniref:E3 ubiquitin-protein ligase TRIM71-like n=1 Tax=Ostrea edulis TaxID=37623 RepID=UPI0024AF72B3|nr:E3 ubiquitin-protein ligase TRIM71-like [Ostrea edulis]XP_048743780.2 E3 ubiquitin-protein ligase TRIM71-like [Ostrea edulis]XP_048743783.2 E3 ubiquitin-protein ligase TRIM71-like [Ostrea edulis]
MAQAQAQDVIRCQYCEDEPALFQCLPCGDELCSKCKVFHLKSKVPSGHKIISFSESLDPSNMIKMCEKHPTKPYEVCCEDCQVPVCIICIEETHGKHTIGKMKNLYEEQKTSMVKELHQLKNQFKLQVTQTLAEAKSGKSKLKKSHEKVRSRMSEEAKQLIDQITAMLNKTLQESKDDEEKEEAEISKYETKLEVFQQQLEKIIEKYENLTQNGHPADLILYRKQSPHTVKNLTLPDRIEITPLSFKSRKLQDMTQFGDLLKTKIRYQKVGIPAITDDGDQSWKPEQTNKKLLVKPELLHKVDIKNKSNELYHVECVDETKAYVSGSGPGILLIDTLGKELENVITEVQPRGLAVMFDDSLIFSTGSKGTILKVSHDKKMSTFVKDKYNLRGLCCTKSGDILACTGPGDTARVVRYRSSGEKIQEIVHNHNGKKLYSYPRFVCENINGDVCVADRSNPDKLVVVNMDGEFRFNYHGKTGHLKYTFFTSLEIATDSLGHILISDCLNNVLHLISKDGEFISFLLTQDVLRPRGLSIDKSDNLWIGEWENSCVKMKIYKFLS